MPVKSLGLKHEPGCGISKDYQERQRMAGENAKLRERATDKVDHHIPLGSRGSTRRRRSPFTARHGRLLRYRSPLLMVPGEPKHAWLTARPATDSHTAVASLP